MSWLHWFNFRSIQFQLIGDIKSGITDSNSQSIELNDFVKSIVDWVTARWRWDLYSVNDRHLKTKNKIVDEWKQNRKNPW